MRGDGGTGEDQKGVKTDLLSRLFPGLPAVLHLRRQRWRLRSLERLSPDPAGQGVQGVGRPVGRREGIRVRGVQPGHVMFVGMMEMM